MNAFVPLQDTNEVAAILSSISLLGGVPENKRDGIFHRLEFGVIKKGDFVFRKGDEPRYIYIVKSGSIELCITDGDVLIDKKALGVGESFGEASLMSMHRHTATAVAIEDSGIIVLSRHSLVRLQQEDICLFALIMMNIARELARRLQLTDDILLHYLHARELGVAATTMTAPVCLITS